MNAQQFSDLRDWLLERRDSDRDRPKFIVSPSVFAPFLSANPVMWIMPFAKAFTIVLLGGLGSVTGSVVAALILGYSETVVSFAISPRVTELVAFVVLFFVIVLKPSGLRGSAVGA